MTKESRAGNLESVASETAIRLLAPVQGDDDDDIDDRVVTQFVDLGNNVRLQLVWSSPDDTATNMQQQQQQAEQAFDVVVPAASASQTADRRLRIVLQRYPRSSEDNELLSTPLSATAVSESAAAASSPGKENSEDSVESHIHVDNFGSNPLAAEEPMAEEEEGDDGDDNDDHDDDGSIQEEQQEDDPNEEGDVFVESTSFGSSLHHLFWSPRPVRLEDVMNILDQDPTAASLADASNGKLPLHILSEHDMLFFANTEQGREEAKRIAHVLMRAYPAAMTTTDSEGNMPFVARIKSWVTTVYEEDVYKQQQQHAGKSSSLMEQFVIASLSPIAKLRASAGAWSPERTPHGSIHRSSTNGSSSSSNNNRSHRSNLLARTLSLPPVPGLSTASSKASSRLFPVTCLPEEVEWCFEMLSLGLDVMSDSSQMPPYGQQPSQLQNKPLSSKTMTNKSRDVIRESRMTLATNLIQQVPLLIKTMLLLEDSTERQRVWSMPIFRQVLVNEAAIGPWLTHMLRRHGMPSERAIDFFILVSESKVEDLIGTLTPASEDNQAFAMEQLHVFQAIEALGETIPSLALLNDPKEIERAAATSVVWFVMNKELSSPFTVGLILTDVVLHLTLLICFRSQANLPRSGAGVLLTNVPVGIVLTICAHYMIRKITEGVALFNISPVLMQRSFWNVWRIMDFATIIITIGATSWASRHSGQYRPVLNAIVLGLLWMKMLGFLKVVNRETATFILSLFEIIKDIRNFLLVLLVLICMFADMLHVLITTDDDHFCTQSGPLDSSQTDFCSPRLIDGYLRTYVILMNDFDLSSFRESNVITFVFILYTLLGSIIMLNVLIAVINESYQKSRVSSALLFGRARVGFVAEHAALEQFLQPGENPFEQLVAHHAAEEINMMPHCGLYVQALGVAGRWLVLLSLLGTAAFCLVYLVGKAVAAPRIEKSIFVTLVFAILSILLALAMLVITHSCFSGVVTGVAPRPVARRVVAAFDFPAQHITRFVSVYLFGLTEAAPPVGLFTTFQIIHRGGGEPSQRRL